MPVTLTPIGTISAGLSAASGLMTATLTHVSGLSATLDFAEQRVLVNTVFTYLGSVPDLTGLPNNALNGDTYYVEDETTYYAWMGEEWQDIGPAVVIEDLTESEKTTIKGMVNSNTPATLNTMGPQSIPSLNLQLNRPDQTNLVEDEEESPDVIPNDEFFDE